jgi:hypothetical protein
MSSPQRSRLAVSRGYDRRVDKGQEPDTFMSETPDLSDLYCETVTSDRAREGISDLVHFFVSVFGTRNV